MLIKRLRFIIFCGFLFIAFLIFPAARLMQSEPAIFIRVNQLGFLPNDLKGCVVVSSTRLAGTPFYVIDRATRVPVYSSTINRGIGPYGNFTFYYKIDFSSLIRPGAYFIQVREAKSAEFIINETVYNNLVDSLLFFFKVQRCGATRPRLHAPCHLHDATSLIINGQVVDEKVDVSGGWHDAGDYIKFLNTTAYAAYTLLFSYLFDPNKFGFDRDNDGLPDILAEAKIGLDWLAKLNYRKDELITQVQNIRDHEQGWRLPESDPLTFDRPAFVGKGKNLIGIYAATMAVAYRAYKDTPSYRQFADNCLTLAENIYSIRNEAPNLDVSGTGAYRDSQYAGKMALAAVELHLATGREEYLREAQAFADAAGSDFWWSWGDVNSYAHYRLAKIDPRFKIYLNNNLKFFTEKKKPIFGEARVDNWGANNTILGVALQAILWKDLTGENSYGELAVAQRDFILGKNQWGLSFIYNIGADFSKNFHSQIAFFNRGRLPGAVAAGPMSKMKLEKYMIPYESVDLYARFQTASAIYRDDRMDYITNEPTIVANATAVFVMGCSANRK